jgi:hypothetical protein
MANEENSKPNQGSGILNEGRTIPLLTPKIGFEEKGFTIPLPTPMPTPTPTQSQEIKPEAQPDSNKSTDK